MDKKLGSLYVELIGKIDKFQSSMNQAQKVVNRTARKFESIGKDLTLAVSLPLAAVGAAAIKMSMEMDEALDSIRIGTGKAGKEFEAMQDSFLKVFKSVPVSAKEAADAITEISKRTGLTGTALENLAVTTLNLARATKSNVNQVISESTRLFENWNIATEDQTKTLDELFRATQVSGVSLESLLGNLTKFGPVMRQIGLSFEQSTALLAKWEKEGFNTEKMTVGLQLALTKLAKSGVKDTQAALTGMIAEIKNAGSQAEANALAIKLFGKSGIEMGAAIRRGAFDVGALYDQIKNGKETINSAIRDTDGFSESLTKLKNTVMAATVPIEGTLTGMFESHKGLLESFRKGIEDIGKAFEALSPQTKELIVSIGGLLVVIGPLVGWIAKLGKILVGTVIIGGIKNLAFAFTALNTVFWTLIGVLGALLTPFGAVAAAVGALIVLGYQLYQNWEPLKQFFSDLFENIQKAIVGAWGEIEKVINQWEKAFGQWLIEVGKATTGIVAQFLELKDKAIQYAEEMYNGVKTYLVDKFQAIVQSVKDSVDSVIGFFDNMYEKVVGHSSVPDTVDAIEKEFGKLDSVMVQPVSEATDSAIGDFDRMKQAGLEAANALSDAFTRFGEAMGLTSQSASILGNFFASLLTGVNTGGPGGALGSSAGGSGGVIGSVAGWFGNSSTGGGSYSQEQMDAGGAYGPTQDGGNLDQTGGNKGSTNYAGYAQAGLQIFDSFQNSEDKDKATGSNAGTGQTAGAAVGAIIGAYFGQPAAGAAIGGVVGEIIGGLFKRGSQNPETKARHAFANWLEDQFEKLGQVSFYDAKGVLQSYKGNLLNFVEGSNSRFNPGGDTGGKNWDENFRAMGDEATQVFGGLGQAFKQILGLTDAVAEHIAYLLAVNLGGNINNARLLIKQLGITQEEVMAALFESAKKGEISWQQYNIQVAGITKAFGEGLVEVGAYNKAFQDLIDSGGRGYDAIFAAMNIGVEAGEAGIKTLDQLKASLIAGGANAQYVEALFKAAAARGITTLEQWQNMSEQTTGAIVGDMGNANKELSDTWAEMAEQISDIKTDLQGIPTNLNSVVSIDLNISDEDREALDTIGGLGIGGSATASSSSGSSPGFGGISENAAKGKVVHTPSTMRMANGGMLRYAELAPEAIMPLSRTRRGDLGVAVTGLDKNRGMQINVYAPNSQAGQEQEIRRAIEDIEQSVIEKATDSVLEQVRRGGGFAQPFGA